MSEQRQFDVGVIDTPIRARNGTRYIPGNSLVALSPDGTEQWSVDETLPPLTIGEKYVYTRDQTTRRIQIISQKDGTVLKNNIPGSRVSDIVFLDGTIYSALHVGNLTYYGSETAAETVFELGQRS